MADALPSRMTLDTCLACAAEQPERYELERGTVIAMSPERLGHVCAKTASFDALAAAVARAKLPCEARPSGTAPARDALAIVAPVIVAEVLSPSTGRRDHHQKLVGDVMVAVALPDAERATTASVSSGRDGRIVTGIRLA